MNCINCGAEIHSKYCSECGQRTSVKRITFKEGWYDFWARIYGFDGLFPRTLRDLTLRPGVATRAFISGNRTLYYGPVGYFFLMITVVLLFMSLLDVDLMVFLKSGHGISPLHPKVNSDNSTVVSRILGFVSNNIKIISFLIIPFQAFCARFIFFRKRGFNFIEHFVLPFYILGHLYWITLLVVLNYKFLGDAIPNTVWIVTSMLFFGYAYSNFIGDQPFWKTFLKGVGILITAQILFIVLVTVFILLLAIINPDFYQLMKPSNNP